MRRHIFRLCTLASLTFSFAHASLHYPTSNRDHGTGHTFSTKRSPDHPDCYPVLGVKGQGGSGIHPRLEIRELERKPDQFNVYILGLQRFQQVDQDERLSYFRVAGIHGRPFVPWDGVEKHEQGELGYCRHSSNIFAPWHRPYLALLEELIYVNARSAISEFPEGAFKNRMNIALQAFRLPYWDAAAMPPEGEGSFPWVVQRRTLEIEFPDGDQSSTKRTIANPLYSYVFHPLPVDDFRSLPLGKPDQWIQWNCTKRMPTVRDVSAESQNREVSWHLDWNQANQRQRTYQMLAIQKDYNNISNNAIRNKDPISGVVLDSLESVHDTLHNTVGDGGHMWQTQYSSFDPIFWLLHANTDRLMAIWQALNPNSYVTNQTNTLATFTTPPKSWADENTPLHPFHRNEAGDFWTSASVRDHTVFGYTYPELQNVWEPSILIRRVNALYGENATSQFSWNKAPQPQPVSVPTTLATSASPTASTSCVPTPRYERRGIQRAQRNDVHYYYFANIRAQKGGAAGAYKVFVFLGDPASETSSKNWSQDPGFVGYTGFQNAASPNENNEQQEETFEANGVVALTQALEERKLAGELRSLDEDSVADYLRRNMQWRLSVIGDRIIPPEEAPGFEIEVSWAKMVPPREDSFPQVQGGGFQHLALATSGKVGGV